jgi:hypothetical protein
MSRRQLKNGGPEAEPKFHLTLPLSSINTQL